MPVESGCRVILQPQILSNPAPLHALLMAFDEARPLKLSPASLHVLLMSLDEARRLKTLTCISAYFADITK